MRRWRGLIAAGSLLLAASLAASARSRCAAAARSSSTVLSPIERAGTLMIRS